MNKSFDASGAQFAWDSTSLKTADECLRKYFYKNIEGWSAPTKSFHLRFGAIYATALEHYTKFVAAGMPREEAIVSVVHEALISSWDYAYRTPEGAAKQDPDERIPGSGHAWETGDTNKTRSTLIRTIVWYFEHFEEDLPVIILSDGRPAVEYSFSLPVDNGIMLCGHIDKLVTFGDSPMILDQKTTKSTVGPYYFDQYTPDTQMSLYTYAGSIIYNLPIKGVMIDAAQIAIGFSRFERGFAFRTETQLQEWYEGAMHTIERARKATVERYFPMNTTACGNYGGCEFRAICSRSPEVRETFLKGNFTKGATWDPIERR